MSLRSFIGLCEHRWQDESLIERKVANAFRESMEQPATMTNGIRIVQRCTVCGKARSVAL